MISGWFAPTPEQNSLAPPPEPVDSIVGVLSIPNEAEMKPFAVSEKSIQPYWTNALNLFSGMSLQVVTSSSETSYSEMKLLNPVYLIVSFLKKLT